MSKPFSIDIKQDNDLQKITFSGQLIINHIDAIKEEFIESINLTKPLSISVNYPDGIDITFIQLIVAIKKAYNKNGIHINVEGKLHDEALSLIANAGFNNLLKL
ncbi:hypothetical protein SAMN06265379_10375 [Saccharicrinis carchari]|uniref:STAS domain-containing protein n=1 Tax=Saccharicrinis carchari TaxID=1168039 RepID=A0A521CEZ2_SACCC|nr:hypothetical protein [Saccharicrinis carchari]SMO58006.1 hypothetical protein SAMN06265379_10375 [Saccharicrinis carchari]